MNTGKIGTGLWGAGCALFSAVAAPNALAQIAVNDVTATSGSEFMHTPAPLMIPGIQDWMPSGIAVGDFDRDGWPDMFWLGGGGVPDKLFMNNGDGTFTDRAQLWGVAALHGGCGACAGDYDGDGWLDIYVTSFGTAQNNQGELGKNRLYRNNGNGTFTNVAEQAGVNFTSYILSSGYGCNFGDYDLDGDLDLCVLAWYAPGKGNRLYENNGDGTFTDVTESAITFPYPLWGFQGCFADMDEDGWPELLVAADFGTSQYFHNNGDGTFTNMTVASGTGLDEHGMGQCVGDFDNDGDLDWYVTSIFQDNSTPRLPNTGNKLYLNQGENVYIEDSVAAGVDDGGWGWGAVAVDLDHDTLLDIVEVNGRPGSTEFQGEQEYVFRNNGGGTFAEVTDDCGFTVAAEGKAIVTLDYDGDGDLDLAAGFNSNFNKLYRNESGSQGSWLHLSFDTQNNPRLAPDGFGARVTVTIGEQAYVRYVDSGPGFLGTGEICAQFGLGAAEVADEVEVHWPRGYTSVLHDVPLNQRLVIQSPSLADLDGDGIVGGADIGELLGRWGVVQSAFDLKADLNNDHVVDAADLGLLLGAWGE